MSSGPRGLVNHLLVSGELEDYEDGLEDEWSRYRDVVFEKLDSGSRESVLREAGQRLYQWADLETGNISSLRIRERVTEPYVVRGCFHILAKKVVFVRDSAPFNFGSKCHEILESPLLCEFLTLASSGIEASPGESKLLLLLFAVLTRCSRNGVERSQLRLWKHGILSPRSLR